MSFVVPPTDPVSKERFEAGLRMGARGMGFDVSEATKRFETINLSTWARLCFLAEAVDRLVKDGSPEAMRAAAAARAAMPQWLQRDALAVPVADSPGEPWRQWQLSAKAVVARESKAGKLQALQANMIRAAKAATSAIAPAAVVSGVVSSGISAARKYLSAAIKGAYQRIRKIPKSTAGAAAAGAGAAAAGAGAVAAGSAAGQGATAPGGLLAPGGPLDPGYWSWTTKLIAGVAVGFGGYLLYRKFAVKAPAAAAPVSTGGNGNGKG